jgi:methylthioribose-1-phosphate isomerase
MHLQAIKYEKGKLQILNQLLLPKQLTFEQIESTQDAFDAIRQMKVRGAPAIAIVALLSIAIELQDIDRLLHSGHLRRKTKLDLKQYLKSTCEHLCSSRPTAVNIKREADQLLQHFEQLLQDTSIEFQETVDRVEQYLFGLLDKDLQTNRSIGRYGSDHLIATNPSLTKLNVLTICNTGSLATSGYGTALGVVRSLHQQSRLDRCYFVETRPYLQGARLTAVELLHDLVPATLICDSMVSALMRHRQLHAVVVGVDRLAANGDFANKIGTQQMAVLAQHYRIPFYVACPLQSIDWTIESGVDIPVEQRPAKEMQFVGDVQIAPEGSFSSLHLTLFFRNVTPCLVTLSCPPPVQKWTVGIRRSTSPIRN